MTSSSLILFSLMILLLSNTAQALDYAKCSKLLNDGWYKKYEYGGIDQPLTKATKKHGASKASSVTSTEGTTALSDPGYYTNITTSETQLLSSFGACSAIALQKIKENRNRYLVQNARRALMQIATGAGEHVNVIATFSLCEDIYFDKFAHSLQAHMKSFIERSDESYGALVDQIVSADMTLSRGCHVFN